MCVHDKRQPKETIMDSPCETTNGRIRSRLVYKNGFLCVLGECRAAEGSEPAKAKLWYPIRAAYEAEILTIVGRPVTEVDSKGGIYVDEEGTFYQLADKGETRPMAVEEIAGESGVLADLLAASLKNGDTSGKVRTDALQRAIGRRRKTGARGVNGSTKPGTDEPCGGVIRNQPALPVNNPLHGNHHDLVQLNLRQKLAEVRRRIGYVQKRGFNERNNYSYVTAADLAGAVGDILAELGV
jgi:hypothetical protein